MAKIALQYFIFITVTGLLMATTVGAVAGGGKTCGIARHEYRVSCRGKRSVIIYRTNVEHGIVVCICVKQGAKQRVIVVQNSAE